MGAGVLACERMAATWFSNDFRTYFKIKILIYIHKDLDRLRKILKNVCSFILEYTENDS